MSEYDGPADLKETVAYLRRLEPLQAERDRLKALNAELVEALEMLLDETVTVLTKHFAQPRHDMIEDVPSIAKARAVLAKACKES